MHATSDVLVLCIAQLCIIPATMNAAGDEIRLKHPCPNIGAPPWTGSGLVVRLNETSEEVCCAQPLIFTLTLTLPLTLTVTLTLPSSKEVRSRHACRHRASALPRSRMRASCAGLLMAAGRPMELSHPRTDLLRFIQMSKLCRCLYLNSFLGTLVRGWLAGTVLQGSQLT